MKTLKRSAELLNQTMKKAAPQKPDKVVALKVMDLTIWKGLKFGFGFAAGIVTFMMASQLAVFLFKTFVLGLFAYFGFVEPPPGV
jgi:hypothetical protein